MPEELFQVPAERRRRIRGSRRLWPAVSAVFCAIAVAIIIFRQPKHEPRTPVSKSQSTPTEAAPLQTLEARTDPIPPSAAEREQAVEDSAGELLWASPTTGEPLSLAYVPAGTQCLIHARPALLASHPEGERVLAALGRWGQSVVSRLKTALNTELADIESLFVAIVVTADGKLDAYLRAKLISPVTDDSLAARFPSSKLNTHGERSYHVVGDRAYFIPQSDQHAIVACPANLAAELIDSGGDAPPLVRDIERLVEHADADRALTVIVAPKFLEASGNELLVAEAAPLHDALHWLLGADATAIALSAHWDDNFFVELRATPALNIPARRLAAKLRERVVAAPDAIEETILASPWHPYGRKVLARLPAMLRALARYARAGEDDRQALVRAYLPPMAGHNLLMAAELLLTQPRAGELAAATGPATPKKPATLEGRLAVTTSLTFSKDSLERALELLAEDVGIEITIQGADLQLDGITKNQSLALDLRDRPTGEILTEILLKANPDRTATGPADVRQKLVYVIEPGPAGDPGRIIVTTRTAAEKRGDRLPDAFLLKDR